MTFSSSNSVPPIRTLVLVTDTKIIHFCLNITISSLFYKIRIFEDSTNIHAVQTRDYLHLKSIVILLIIPVISCLVLYNKYILWQKIEKKNYFTGQWVYFMIKNYFYFWCIYFEEDYEMVSLNIFKKERNFRTSLCYTKNLYIGYEKTINPKTWNIL